MKSFSSSSVSVLWVHVTLSWAPEPGLMGNLQQRSVQCCIIFCPTCANSWIFFNRFSIIFLLIYFCDISFYSVNRTVSGKWISVAHTHAHQKSITANSLHPLLLRILFYKFIYFVFFIFIHVLLHKGSLYTMYTLNASLNHRNASINFKWW